MLKPTATRWSMPLLLTAGLLVLPWWMLTTEAADLGPEYKQGMVFYNKGYIEKALPFLRQAAADHPESEDAQLWLARAYRKQGTPADLEVARQTYYKVHQLNPGNLEALTNLGELLSWDKTTRPQAIAFLKQAAMLEPGNTDHAKRATEVLSWEGRFAEAYDYAQPIAAKYAGDRAWQAVYAKVLSETGHAEDAVAVYRDTLSAGSSSDLKLQQDYTLALHKAKHPGEAGEMYDRIRPRILSLTGGDAAAMKERMAGLTFDMGRYSDALTFDQSLPAATQNEKYIQLRMARSYVHTQQAPQAMAAFKMLYEAGQLSSDEKLEFADYLSSLSMKDSSLMDRLYAESLSQDTGNAMAAFRLAKRYEATGQFSEANKYYQLALSAADVQDPESIRSNYLEMLKNEKTNLTASEQAFQKLMADHPGDTQVEGAYADFLSYQKSRQNDAIRMFLALSQKDPAHQDQWLKGMERTLLWHEATVKEISFYQELANVYPDNYAIRLTVARAYRNDPDYFKEALDLYHDLLKRYPGDDRVQQEWTDLLLMHKSHRDDAVKLLRQAIEENPGNVAARIALGKLLSYERHYSAAIEQCDAVLAINPNNIDAIVTKGYALMWSGKQLVAKDYLEEAFERHPGEMDVAVALAQVNKFLGRYDDAFDVMKKVRHLINFTGYGWPADLNGDWLIPVDYEVIQTGVSPSDTVFDYSILPYQPADTAAEPAPEKQSQAPSYLRKTVEERVSLDEVTPPSPVAPQAGVHPDLARLQADMDSLNMAIESLKAVQKTSQKQLDRIQSDVAFSKDHIVTGVAVLDETAGSSQAQSDELAFLQNNPEYGIFSAINYDTNPLLSGLGRFRNDDLTRMSEGLENDLRPLLRGGFFYSTQDGEKSTGKFRYWGFPNQLAFSLTPQLRARVSVDPYHYSIPGPYARGPHATWSQAYSWGATYRLTDRLTLDGDMAITQFNQSSSSNITYQGGIEYKFNDAIAAKVGSFRQPQYNSYLAQVGIVPDMGRYAGKLVGQSRETGLFAELNTHPFNNDFDLNAGYQWAYVDGERVPTNYKNLAYLSGGYDWHYAENHKVRLGFESLYFGYEKNTTNGFFDVTRAGNTRPVVSVAPAILAADGYDFGGYFSPKAFFQNAGRLDFRGNLWNKLLEYKLGGSLGVQTFNRGHGLTSKENTAMTASFDANLIMNLTDWLALYGNMDYTDAGSSFDRWRFGGGMIVRPAIDFLSPIIGGKGRGDSGSASTSSAK
ncbi:MAG: tetratricopeptide repeat protein [Candidatus Melainabacteria bacterium]